MKILNRSLWLFLALVLAGPTQALAELKLGYVDAARLLEKAPQADLATKRLKEEFAPREEDIFTLQKEVTESEDQLRLNGDVMTEEGRRKIERQVIANKRDLRRIQDEFREDLTFRRNEEIAKIQVLVRQVIELVGKEEKFDLILYEGIAYASQQVDLTNKILERLNKEVEANK